MMQAAVEVHPSVELLKQYGAGELPEPECTVVEGHVETCMECCTALRGLHAGPLAERLRAAAQAHRPSADTAPSEVATVGPVSVPADLPAEVPGELRDHPRYHVIAVLGRGGMGVVYRAEHRFMARPVALKVLNAALTANPQMVDRFGHEVRAAAKLIHPNIVQAFDAEQLGDLHFLVMEFVPGVDLARHVTAQGPLPVAAACDMVCQAALGLQHAFEHGMTHRDVKPHNLILTEDGVVKVLDFGLARMVREADSSAPSGVTGEGMILGTVDYMAPEQGDDPRNAGIRSDIYALGCTLYHLLTGRVPFPGGSMTQKLRAHAAKEAEPLRALRTDVPEAVALVVARMMAKAPADRFATPAEVAAALAPFTSIVEAPALAPASAASDFGQPATLEEQRGPSRKPRRLLRTALAAALLVLLAAVAVVYRIQTDKGDLEITVTDDDVEVTVKQGGKIVEIVDNKTNKRLRLPTGEYDLGLKAPDGFELDLKQVTIRRGGRELATVRRVAKTVEVKPPVHPADDKQPKPFDPPPGLVWKRTNLGGGIAKPALSPDGRYVAFGASGPNPRGVLFDVRTRRELCQFPCLWQVAFTGDGKYLVSQFEFGRLALYRVPSGEQVRVFRGNLPGLVDFNTSPDGRHVVASIPEKSIVWDVDTGEPVLEARWKAFFSHDGKRLLGFDFVGDKARALELPEGKLVAELSGVTEQSTRRFTLLPGDRTLFRINSDTSEAELWDLATGKKTGSFALGRHWLAYDWHGANVSADGKRMLTGHDDGFVRLWDIAARREVWRMPVDEIGVHGTTFSGDGRFAVAGGAGNVYVWRLPDPDKPCPPPPKVFNTLSDGTREHPWDVHVYHTAFSPDGDHYLATASLSWNQVRIWSAKSGELTVLPGWQWAQFTPDGKQVLAVQADNSIAVLDLATRATLRRLEGHQGWPNHFDISHNGKRLLSTALDDTIRLWDVVKGAQLDQADCSVGKNRVCYSVFSPDGKRAATWEVGGLVRLWDVSGDRLRFLRRWQLSGEDAASQVRFTADNRRLVIAGAGGVSWFDLDADKPSRTLPLEGIEDVGPGMWNLSAEADKLIFRSRSDNTVRVLDLETGKEAARFTVPVELFPLKGGRLVGIPALSPDGRFLVVPAHRWAPGSGYVGRVYLWPLPRDK